MAVYAASEVRMHFDTSGRVRAAHPAAAYDYWKLYAEALGEVSVVARVDTRVRDDGVLVEGPGVRVLPMPHYAGALQLPWGMIRVRAALKSIGDADSVFIVRLPEFMSLALHRRARDVNGRVAALLVADPETLYPALLPAPLGALAGRLMRRSVRKLTKQSDAVVYVSQRVLQSKYPASAGVPTLGRSNVQVPESWFTGSRALKGQSSRSIRLITIGTMASRVKGVDFLLDVLVRLRAKGVVASLSVVGDGRYRGSLETLARKKGVSVTFHGQVSARSNLSALLDGADVYVSGSRSEGLSRAMVEAMARGLPVVSTKAGAVEELLTEDYLAPVGDVERFVARVQALAEDSERYARASAENVATARQVVGLADPGRLTVFLSQLAQGDRAVHPNG